MLFCHSVSIFIKSEGGGKLNRFIKLQNRLVEGQIELSNNRGNGKAFILEDINLNLGHEVIREF